MAFDETFDFVVVGSGGGSMCSSLVMRDAGKSVVILEKTDLLGGTCAKSGGVMWLPNNPFMKRDGVPDSPEQALAYMDSVIGDDPNNKGATRERRIRYIREAPRMVNFLTSQGVKLTRVGYYPDYYNDRPGGSVPGRTVVAQLFNANELGPWKAKLRPGSFAYQAMLDLHGMSAAAARVEVERFIMQALAEGHREVLIVHGRGHNSKDNIPVLKERLKSWLARGRIGRSILAFTSARPADGGPGAVYVLLRRRRGPKEPITVYEGAKRE